MGVKAKRRRIAKETTKAAKPRAVRRLGDDTRTMRLLREKMAQVKTLSQFEEMVYAAVEDERPAVRRLLEPMLPQGLPCCGRAMLAKAQRRTIVHATLCPEARLVKLATD